MNNEQLILEMAKANNGIITSKQVDQMNIPRVYLSRLHKKGELKKIERGIYAVHETVPDNFYNLQLKSKMVIFSHFTALEILGFYKAKDIRPQITVLQGYNASKFTDYKIFYDSNNYFMEGVVEVKNANNNTLKVYELERSICDIIRNKNRFEESDVNKVLNYYFTQPNINYQKLLYYSKLLKVSKKVQNYMNLLRA